MDIRSAFPSKYVAAGDLCGQDLVVTILDVRKEDVGDAGETKSLPVMYFQGFAKGMILNHGKATILEKLYGYITEQWAGKQITLYPSTTQWKSEANRPCICIREQAPQAPAAPAQPAPAMAQPPQQAVAQQPQQEVAQQAPKF